MLKKIKSKLYPSEYLEKYSEFQKNKNLSIYEFNGVKYQITKKERIYCFFFEHSLNIALFLCAAVNINIINIIFSVIFRAVFWVFLGTLSTAISLRLLVKELEENKIS